MGAVSGAALFPISTACSRALRQPQSFVVDPGHDRIPDAEVIEQAGSQAAVPMHQAAATQGGPPVHVKTEKAGELVMARE